MLTAILLAASFTGCGQERAAVKNLRDAGAAQLVGPRKTTVAELLSLPAPRWSNRAPRRRIERQVVELDVEVIAFKDEEDGDVHAILRGGRGEVMVAEFAFSACTLGSRFARPMETARRRFAAAMRQHVQRLRLTGVVFFDKVHGQTGGAPSGVEVHPVLKVEVLGDNQPTGERNEETHGE